jgi:hypothetical protein
MPYVKKERREVIDDALESLLIFVDEDTPETLVAGDLNYIFTQIANQYLLGAGLNYQNINNVIGAMEGAKLELYRRVAAPYEDKKAAANGDAYDHELLGK